jgi:hypothetical protein
MTAAYGRTGRAIWLGGAAVTVAALVSAALVLALYVAQLPDTRSIAGIVLPPLATLVLIAAGAALVGAVAILGRTRPTAALGLAAAIFVVIRTGVVIAFNGPLTSDWRAYHQLAIGWTLGAPPIANRSMGYPALLGEAYRIAGIHPAVGEVLNLLLTLVGVALLAALVDKISNRRVAAVVVALLAVAPSQAFFTVLLGTETLYTTALVAVAYVVVLMLYAMRSPDASRRTLVLAALAGLLLGTSTYVRATSVVILPFIAVLPLVAAPRRRAIPVALAIVVVAAVALVPAVAANRTYLGRWSASTTLFTGWQLYLGSNVQEAGRFNDADAARINGAIPGYDAHPIATEYARGIFDPVTLQLAAERDDYAFQAALARIRRDWIRLPLVAPLKVVYAWGPADSSPGWVLPTEATGNTWAAHVVQVAAQAWWVIALAGMALWYLRRRHAMLLPGLVVGAIVVPIALSLLALEVQPRYHEYVVPLVAALASIAILGERRVPASVSADEPGPRPASPPAVAEESPVCFNGPGRSTRGSSSRWRTARTSDLASRVSPRTRNRT